MEYKEKMMKSKSYISKLIIVITIIAMCTLGFLGSKYLSADTLQDYEKQYEDIKAQQKATADNLTGIDKEIAQDTYDMMDLDGKITQYSVQLASLQKKVDDVNGKLAEQEKALQESAQKYNSAEDIYATRLRVIYENGIPSMLDILFSAQNISDFFSKMNVLTSILDYDKSLVGNMQSQKEYIDYIKSDIEVQKAQLEQLTYDTQKSSQALDDARVAKENKMNQLQSSKEDLKKRAQALMQQEQDMARKIDEENARRANMGGSFSGQFLWPINAYPIPLITTMYNEAYDPWNTGHPTYHTGTDIAGSGIYGKPILAMESGVVSVASYGYNGGYGNYVQIDHGKSRIDGQEYRTLYGHASSLAVTKGQSVTRGQVIGYVGSTGNSTGPHLHVEIRKNNVRGAILDYFKGMTITYEGRTYKYGV